VLSYLYTNPIVNRIGRFLTEQIESNQIDVNRPFSKKGENKALHKPHGPRSGTDLCFSSRQPDTSLHCEATDTGAGALLGWYQI